MTCGNEEVVRIPYIHYPVRFQDCQEWVRTLFNSNSKVNAINTDYAWKLGLKIWKTNVRAQKINGSALEIFEIVITDFQVKDKASRPRFFEKTFLVVVTKFEVILGMLFVKISNIDVLFDKKYSRRSIIPLIKPYLLLSKSKLLMERICCSSIRC